MYSMMYSFWFSKACQQYDVDVWGPRWLMTGILDQFSLRVHFSSSRKFNSLAVARSCRSFRHSLAVDLPWQNKSIQILAPPPEKISRKLWTGVLWSNCGFATQPGSIKRTSLHARGRNSKRQCSVAIHHTIHMSSGKVALLQPFQELMTKDDKRLFIWCVSWPWMVWDC